MESLKAGKSYKAIEMAAYLSVTVDLKMKIIFIFYTSKDEKLKNGTLKQLKFWFWNKMCELNIKNGLNQTVDIFQKG